MNLLECKLDTIHCPGVQQMGEEEGAELNMDWWINKWGFAHIKLDLTALR